MKTDVSTLATLTILNTFK